MDKQTLDAAVPTTQQAASAKRTKVAILGFVQHYKLAPFNDPSFEIWGLNELYQFIPRWDRWFEIHPRALYENDRNRVSDHVNKLKAMTCPIYMHQHWDDIPGSVPYPLQAIAQMFPNPCPEARPYYNNSITYMILLAIAEGFRELHLYGVDMSHDCLAPEMRVLTADLRWIRAGDLRVGQELLAFDEEIPNTADSEPAQFRKYRKTTVESLSSTKRPCQRLTMDDGTVLVASEGHKWLTLGGTGHERRWLETHRLQSQAIYPKHASKIVKLLETWQPATSWGAGYLAGAFDGEGHVSQGPRPNTSSTHMSVGFSQKQNAMSAQVKHLMDQLGFRMTASEPPEGCFRYSVRGTRAELLRFLGTIRPPRLLEKLDLDRIGCLNSVDDVPVLESEPVGEQETVGIRTGTQTLIVEGYASHNSEYHDQRPSCEWAVGLAQGRGIKVYIPSESDLLKCLFLYGFEEEAARAFDRKLAAREAELAENIAKCDNEIARLSEMRGQYRGAHQDTQHFRKNWKSLHSASSS